MQRLIVRTLRGRRRRTISTGKVRLYGAIRRATVAGLKVAVVAFQLEKLSVATDLLTDCPIENKTVHARTESDTISVPVFEIVYFANTVRSVEHPEQGAVAGKASRSVGAGLASNIAVDTCSLS